MADKREEILARLAQLAGQVKDIKTALRGVDTVAETSMPAMVVNGADESADESGYDRGRPAHSKTRVEMMPDIWIFRAEKSANLETLLNESLAHFRKAVLTDAALIDILGTNGKIEYIGCKTGFKRGRQMDGTLRVDIRLVYVLDPTLILI